MRELLSFMARPEGFEPPTVGVLVMLKSIIGSSNQNSPVSDLCFRPSRSLEPGSCDCLSQAHCKLARFCKK